MEVCVGDVIEQHTSDSVLRGHGTLLRGDSLVASRCGQVQRWNQLVLVEPLAGGYTAAVGHVVVGRIAQVRCHAEQQGRLPMPTQPIRAPRHWLATGAPFVTP